MKDCPDCEIRRLTQGSTSAEIASLRARCEAAEAERDEARATANSHKHHYTIAYERLTAAVERADAAERSRDEARAEVNRWAGIADREAQAAGTECRKKVAAEAERDEAVEDRQRIAREVVPRAMMAEHQRDEAREALRAFVNGVEVAGSVTIANYAAGILTEARRVLSGEKEGAQDRWTFKEVEDLTRASWGRGYAKGAEWMREQAARACEAQAEECVEAIHSLHEAEERTGEDYPETVEDQVFAQNVLLDQAGRLRSLPTSPPADTK